MITINVFNQYDDTEAYQDILDKIIQAAYDYMGMDDDKIINIILVNDDEIQNYNMRYRNINKATDVLSFENLDSDDELGDIFISIDKAKSQAKAYQHSFARELAFLGLHGFLHCLGYDHIDKEEEIQMFKLQDDIIENTEFRRANHYEK
jgi:probable rRNA maturation factor